MLALPRYLEEWSYGVPIPRISMNMPLCILDTTAAIKSTSHTSSFNTAEGSSTYSFSRIAATCVAASKEEIEAAEEKSNIMVRQRLRQPQHVDRSVKLTSEELPRASVGEIFVVDTGWKAVLPPWVSERGFKRGRDS